MSIKVISFSLWGNDPKYNDGAIANAAMSELFFPGFECWFYLHYGTVPVKTINELLKYSQVRIIFKEGDLSNFDIKPMTWRFEAIDDPRVELMLSRDTDTRFLYREQLAVNEWIQSGKIFHIMRDHPHHNYKILGGMFGSRKIPNFNWGNSISKFPRFEDRNYDQDFLREIVYPLIQHSAIIHSNFIKFDYEIIRPFPIKYDAFFHFVGEYVYRDESRSEFHVNELKNFLNL